MFRGQSYSVLCVRNIITVHETMNCSGFEHTNVPGLTVSDLKGSVGLILAKVSDMRISIPLDLSSRSFLSGAC